MNSAPAAYLHSKRRSFFLYLSHRLSLPPSLPFSRSLSLPPLFLSLSQSQAIPLPFVVMHEMHEILFPWGQSVTHTLFSATLFTTWVGCMIGEVW